MSGRTRVGALAVAAWLALAGLATSTAGAAGGSLTISATIDGRDVDNADDGDPIVLDPDRTPNVVVRIANDGSEPVSVRSVRLEARAFGLAFVSLENRVDRTIPPGGREELRFPLETSAVGGQATGLLPTTLTLLDDDRDVLADAEFTSDVHGSLWSVEGIFGLAALLFTVVSLALGLVDRARHRLSPNRWWRAGRFAVPGLTAGIAVTFGLAAIRFVSPRAVIWIPLVLVFGIAGFVAGWRSPAPVDDDVIDLVALERAQSDAVTGPDATAGEPLAPSYVAVGSPRAAPDTAAAGPALEPAATTPALADAVVEGRDSGRGAADGARRRGTAGDAP